MTFVQLSFPIFFKGQSFSESLQVWVMYLYIFILVLLHSKWMDDLKW